jgi:hypothetical protein
MFLYLLLKPDYCNAVPHGQSTTISRHFINITLRQKVSSESVTFFKESPQDPRKIAFSVAASVFLTYNLEQQEHLPGGFALEMK